MQIQFLGATRTVTGSKYLLTVQGKKLLIDCGLYQGLKELRLRNWDKFPLAPAEIDAVILTHAHIDHTGYVPVLVKHGFTGKIYCTEPTQDLCAILLPDAGHLQEEEAERANKYGYSKHKPALPLYTRKEAEAIFQQFHTVALHQDYVLFDDVTVRFNRAGHIIGATTVTIRDNETSIVFSGDLGRSDDVLIHAPERVSAADYIVMESTYGDRLHEEVDINKDLGDIIRKTASRGGSVIIPAFAVGRAQMLLFHIYALKKAQLIPEIPVFVDSPMAHNATEILLKYADEHRFDQQHCEVVCGMAQYVNSVAESKMLDNYQYPRIIISASGMATGGRVLHHIRALAGDPRNTILFSGYQAAGTRGAKMLNGDTKIKMFGEEVSIHAEVKALRNISAHADYEEILDWLVRNRFAPRKVFITHGELAAAISLQKKVEAKFGWQCVIPEYLQIEEL